MIVNIALNIAGEENTLAFAIFFLSGIGWGVEMGYCIVKQGFNLKLR
ncbi:hypothetical protein [Mucilaginibacter sp. FT3.2]|nr:hypothetical protein [Mucilaginibacter sp. FT3.2]MBB6231970.1 hypothetical protein [Mucilaginibacter sp. FT3.2]